MKSQAIIFLPPLLLLWVPQWWLAPRRLGRAVALGAGVQGLLLLPLSGAGTLPLLVAVVRARLTILPVASLNCYNLWVLFFNDLLCPMAVYGGLDVQTMGAAGVLRGVGRHFAAPGAGDAAQAAHARAISVPADRRWCCSAWG